MQLATQLVLALPEARSLIAVERDGLWTTSLVVAEKFSKRHDNLLRAIQTIESPASFNALNFEAVEYADSKGERRPMYRISRDGFAFLAMGFTGKKAAEWKVKFLAAFNAMAVELAHQQSHRNDMLRRETRHDGKRARLVLTDAVAEFVEYATAQGSKNARMYFSNITLMEYRALFLIDRAVGDNFRDRLTVLQNMNLATAESIAQRALRNGMAQGLHYKAIYALAKDHVEQVAGLLGRAEPGTDARLLAGAA